MGTVAVTIRCSRTKAANQNGADSATVEVVLKQEDCLADLEPGAAIRRAAEAGKTVLDVMFSWVISEKQRLSLP